MADKDRIYGRYLVNDWPALCVEDNRGNVEVQYDNGGYTCAFRETFNAWKPTALSAADGAKP